MLQLINSGGIFMWVILLTSVFGLAIILEKLYIFLMVEKTLNEKYKNKLYEVIKVGTKEEIIEICSNKRDSVSKLILKTIKSLEIDFDKINCKHRQYIEEVINESILEETLKLEKGMWLLGCVVNTAPQLGLLGTVTGMITSFVALTGNNSTESYKLIASGISEALYTTAFGLIVAIPALIFYNYFNKKIDNIVLEMERASINFFNRLQGMECGIIVKKVIR